MNIAAVSSPIQNFGSQTLPPVGSTAFAGSSAPATTQSDAPRAGASGMLVFRQELQSSLKLHFHAEVGVGSSRYSGIQETPTADAVADETLAVARNVAAQSPSNAMASLHRLRADVLRSQQVTSETVAATDDVAEVDKAVNKIEQGIGELEGIASQTREAASSMLEVDTRSKQRSTIKIRTQEGDIVRLSLRQIDSLSATSTENVDGDSHSSTTEIEFSSRSQMALKVRGELNEAELEAIGGILANAQQIADKFFDGDIATALADSTAFSYDSEQIAGVKMRFRLQQQSEMTYSQQRVSEPLAPPSIAAPDSATDAAAGVDGADTADVTASAVEAPIVTAENDDGVVTDPAPSAVPAQPDAMQGFFELIGSFLRGVSEGFADSGNATFRLQHSESFKLSLLQSVINTVAPDEGQKAADAASQVIEQLKPVEID